MDVGGGSKAKSDPNVVPLCDILLVLLIIFMIVTPIAQKGIDIKLPEPSPPQNTVVIPSSSVVVNIKQDGAIFINQDEVMKAELRRRLLDRFSGRPDKTAFLKAAAQVKYGDVVRVMDIMKGAGIDRIGIILDIEDSSSGGK